MTPVELRMHRRNSVGIGAAVKQEQLSDDVGEVNCPACWAAMRATVRA